MITDENVATPPIAVVEPTWPEPQPPVYSVTGPLNHGTGCPFAPFTATTTSGGVMSTPAAPFAGWVRNVIAQVPVTAVPSVEEPVSSANAPLEEEAVEPQF